MPGLERFPRRERLTRTRDYQSVYGQGRKFVGRDFIFYVAGRDGLGRKFGLAVPRRVGNAVVRNRVKRYLREIYRTRRRRLKDDIALVVVARPSAAELDFHQCATALETLFRRGGVFDE